VTPVRIGSALDGMYFRGDKQTLLAVSLTQDSTLSLAARGLLYAVIVGPDDDGPVTLEWLEQSADSPEVVQAALAELEARGYVEVTR
jgi:hypothetical protein